ncbi:DUF2157 domain-containing protein [Chryseosolibacter indicus]|uniref:DUF2157 domain-containing protein n=1 Tax=Chryseosolibacter indicus TaxID=2782351 RepID=A0ABS5VUF5_9BACT|nr:DUF2157 domain-containing protein [Chryseosolibacter indicus]MBT1705048.1 DUF2157 domain-containing protein [Chryseosolibacter indicus]
MRPSQLQELRDKGLISHDQHTHLHAVLTKKIFSVFYELRTILYLGVLLFTTGIGILIYKNIGEIGHLLSIIGLFALTVGCFVYAFRFAHPYSDRRIKPPTPFYDYIVLLGCLLFISVISYVQLQYSLLDNGMGITTLITALFFFYAAYRFDHIVVLSLAITALASFWSIAISPQKWYSGDFITESNHHNTAIIFGAAIGIWSYILDRKEIKEHFTFTYMNFASLVFLAGALSGMFIDEHIYLLYLLILYLGCGATILFAHKKKSFLFLLYAFVFGYIGTTYLLSDVFLYETGLWFFYLLISCGTFIYFIIRFKNYFKRAE